MRKAKIRANRKVHSDKNKAPKVIRGRTRQSPPAETALERKSPEVGLRVSRAEGLFDGDNGVIEEDFFPPTTGDCETGVDPISLAQKLMG
jgi:hypothetical protein